MSPVQGQGLSLRTRLLGPLVLFLAAFALVLAVLAASFTSRSSQLTASMRSSAEVHAMTLELTRSRAHMQELLLHYRLKRDPRLSDEILEVENELQRRLGQLRDRRASLVGMQLMSDSLLSGLHESRFLRTEMIRSVDDGELVRADEAFRHLSLMREINSARLQDFSRRVQNGLLADERELHGLVANTARTFAGASLFCLLLLWVTASYYGRSVLAPMRNLQEGLRSMARGELKTHLELGHAPRELQEIQLEFNRMARALESSQEKIRGALRLRDEFLAIASHELKTPLTSLYMQTQVASRRKFNDGPAGPSAADFLKRFAGQVETQITRLNHLIEKMLDVSTITAGKLVPRREDMDLNDVVRSVCETVSLQLAQSGCAVTLDLGPAVRGQWDRFRIEQVVLNLLTNAMKYASGASIEVRTTLQGDQAVLMVQDHGAGIAPENQARIFGRFERAVSPDEVSGLGLGLYIVRQILEAHGGSIRVESEVGRGSQFIVELPVDLAVSTATVGHNKDSE